MQTYIALGKYNLKVMHTLDSNKGRCEKERKLSVFQRPCCLSSFEGCCRHSIQSEHMFQEINKVGGKILSAQSLFCFTENMLISIIK